MRDFFKKAYILIEIWYKVVKRKEFKMKKGTVIKNSYGKLVLIILIEWLLASSTIMGRISPLCISFIGGLSGISAAAAFLGASVKLIISGSFIDIVPYIIIMGVITAIRFIMGRNKGTAVAVSSAVLCGSAYFLASVITINQSSELLLDFFLAVVCAIACYGYNIISQNAGKGYELMSSNPVKKLPIAVLAVFLIASLSSLNLGIFNFGIILSAAAVLIAAYKNRFGGAGIVGIICALGLSIAIENNHYAGILLAAGGITAAVMTPKGRIPLTASMIFTASVLGAIFGMDKDMLSFIANIIVGSVVFMTLPLNKIREKMNRKSFAGRNEENTAGVFAGKLELVGETIGELKYAVEKTAEALEDEKGRDISEIYNSSCDRVCKNCRYNIKCWGDEYNDSVRTMNKLVQALKRGESISPESFTGNLSERCPRKQQLCESIVKKYEDFSYIGQMNRRLKEKRGILIKQLDNTEKLFGAIAQDFEQSAVNDKMASAKAERLLERCGIDEPKAAVKLSGGLMSLEAYGKGEFSCSAEELGDMLIQTFQREFDLPLILSFGNKVRITAYERAEYGIKSAECQLSRKNDAANGDCITCFVDGKGYYYSILSDGMGSGTRAKIDSAFVCGLLTKLLECGIEAETAIELLNTSLLVKSSDESFATLDLCRVDLYTGNTTIYKAGGADSYIKSGNNVTKIKGKGLPIGVCESLSLSAHTFIAGENDVIIMTSDGAELSEQWLEQAFSRDSGKNMDELVKTVASAARFNAEKGREDDISVVAIQLKK